MSLVSRAYGRAQTSAQADELAATLFKQGIDVVRALQVALRAVGSCSTAQGSALEEYSSLLPAVVEVVSTLAAALKAKRVREYLAAIGVLSGGSMASPPFPMPSNKVRGPREETPDAAVDVHDLRSGMHRWLRVDALGDADEVPDRNGEAKRDEPEVPGQESKELVAGAAAFEATEALPFSIEMPENLEWLSPVPDSAVQRPGQPAKHSGQKTQIRRIQNVANPASQQRTAKTVAGGGGEPGDALEVSESMEHALPTEHGVRVTVGSLQLNSAAIREQLKKCNLAEVYKNTPKQRRREAAPVADPITPLLPHDRLQRWTYQKLVECGPLASFINNVLREIQRQIPPFFQKVKQMHQLEFLVCIDNSGSMASKEKAVLEALVVLVEVLRKLEFRFAIALWGRHKQEKLLVGFDEVFTFAKGQQIIESFTFDESSQMADCLNSLLHKVWPGTIPKPSTTQRLVLMLTDGFSEQADPSNFSGLKENFKYEMGMLLIREPHHESHEPFLKAVCTHQCWHVLEMSQIDLLPSSLIYILTKMFEAAKSAILKIEEKASTSHLAPEKMVLQPPVKGDIRSFHDITKLAVDASSSIQQQGGIRQRHLFSVCALDKEIPFLTLAQQDSALVRACSESSEQALDQCLKGHEDFFAAFDRESKSLCCRVEQYWMDATRELSSQIQEYSSVLEQFVLPFNKYTRKRAALKGSSLHLPGLIKAVISNFTDKKFFAAKTAGGRRNYSICLVLDVSSSMSGHLFDSAQETLVCFIAALLQSGIESFSIILFGQSVRIIKTEDQPWGYAVLWALMNYATRAESFSRDADAIRTALQLAAASSAPNKKVFVFTDGFGSSGLHLPLVLDRAEQLDVDVVALAVGMDRTNVKHAYKRYVVASIPAVVPQALRALYLEENAVEDEEDEVQLLRAGTDDSVEDILRNPNKVFENIAKQMAGEREATLVRGDKPDVITVDVAVCMDCTGSMSAWITNAKSQIATIVHDIAPRVHKEFPDINLEIKFCLIAYRDYGDQERHAVYPPDLTFTADTDTFCKHVQTLQARGGEDGPEDLLGALGVAGKLKWTSRLRFLVIVADAPAHGRECNDDPGDRFADGDPEGRTMAGVVKPLCDSKVDVIFCQVKASATEKTQKVLARNYEDDSRKLSVVNLFKDDAVEVRRFHFVFCLDESGSMGGSPWMALMRAYGTFLGRRRNDQGAGDLVSTVCFASAARLVCSAVPITTVSPTIDFRSGGTNFDAALACAEGELSKTPADCIPMLIFMSDGCGGGRPVEKIQQFARAYRGFVCHTVGLGNVSQGVLQDMARAGGGEAKFTDEITIAGAFGELASGCAALDGLVSEFGAKIAGMVSTRICVDHL